MKFIFGASLFILAVWMLPSFFGFVLCGLSAYFFHTNGTDLDMEKKRYRNFTSLFSLKFGKWKPLPDIDYVSVFKTTESTKVSSLGAQTTVRNEIIHLNLFYNTNQKITAYSTTDINDAFSVAKEIATVLNIDVLDATKRESEWL